jgi:hypothetical protein
MNKLKSLLNIGLVAGLALCAIAPVSSRADSFTVTRESDPDATLVVINNTSGEHLAVQGTNDQSGLNGQPGPTAIWKDVLYNNFAGTGTFDFDSVSFLYYRLVVVLDIIPASHSSHRPIHRR